MDIEKARDEFINTLMKNEKILDNNPILNFIRDDRDFLYKCSKTYPSAILYANSEFLLSPVFVSTALKQQPSLILLLPQIHREDEDIADIVLSSNVYLFNIFSPKIRSIDYIIDKVLRKSLQQIKFIPAKKFKEENFQKTLHNISYMYPDLWAHIPKKNQSSKLLNSLVEINGAILLFISPELITNDLLIKGIQSNVECITLMEQNLPQINKIDVISQTLDTLEKFSDIYNISDHIRNYYQEIHTRSLTDKINSINKEETKTPNKRKI